MKKLIISITILLTSAICYSQVDTSLFAFKRNGSDGKYSLLENRSTYLGKAAGSVIVPFTMDINAVDTSKWRFIPIGSDGSYRIVENTASFMGKDSGTVRASLNYNVEYSKGTATTTGGIVTLNTTMGIITTDILATNSGGVILVLNSKVTASSLILITISGGTGDMQNTLIGTANILDGSFEVNITRVLGTYDAEAKIHFLIKN